MAAKSMKKLVLLAKLHTTAGVDPVPDAASNAILLRNATITPVSAEYVERALLRPFFGNAGQIATTQYGQVEGEVELAGAGVAGKAPAWGPLLRACGFAETITESVDVRYTPVSGELETIALHTILDGLLHEIKNARGTVTFDVSAKGIPFMRFRFLGEYVPIKDAVNPTGVDYSAFLKPLGVNKKNTPEWSFGAYTGCLQSLSFDVANELEWKSYISCEGAEITDRQPKGSISLQLPTIAALNWPKMVIEAAEQPLSITHGVNAGNIIEINLPHVQITNPSYSDDSGTAMLGLDLNVNPKEGNDEIEIVVR